MARNVYIADACVRAGIDALDRTVLLPESIGMTAQNAGFGQPNGYIKL